MHRRLLAAMLAVALFTPMASAQGEGLTVRITHDVPDAGTTYVGNVNHFGFLILEDGVPSFHHNAQLTITFRNQTFYETTVDSGHDYDGVDQVQVAFPTPGPYQVSVRVPDGSGEGVATFEGQVLPAPTQQAALQLEAPSHAVAGEPTTFTYGLHGANGTLLPHSDVLVEVRDQARSSEVFRVHTHTHDEPQALSYAFPEAGTYTVRLTGYQAFPSPSAAWFRPVVVEHEVAVSPADGPGVPPMPAPPTQRPLENRVDQGEASSPYRLVATYDPYTSVAAGARIHLNTVVLDQTDQPIAHVDFDARLTGPGGQVIFESDRLHEYDGVLELVTELHQVGDHQLVVEATKGDWTGRVTHTLSANPPLVPMGAGPQFTTVAGLDGLDAGTPAELTVSIRDAAGQPLQHSEVQVTLRDQDTGLPVLWHKLHTHDSGDFPFTVTFPQAGTYEMTVDAVDLESTPAGPFHGPEQGTPPVFTAEVAPAPDAADDVVEPMGADTTQSIPAPGLSALVIVLTALAVLRARRW